MLPAANAVAGGDRPMAGHVGQSRWCRSSSCRRGRSSPRRCRGCRRSSAGAASAADRATRRSPMVTGSGVGVGRRASAWRSRPAIGLPGGAELGRRRRRRRDGRRRARGSGSSRLAAGAAADMRPTGRVSPGASATQATPATRTRARARSGRRAARLTGWREGCMVAARYLAGVPGYHRPMTADTSCPGSAPLGRPDGRRPGPVGAARAGHRARASSSSSWLRRCRPPRSS